MTKISKEPEARLDKTHTGDAYQEHLKRSTTEFQNKDPSVTSFKI